MKTHDIVCKGCGKNIAWWSCFDNNQYTSEYECSGIVVQKEMNCFAKPNGRLSFICCDDKELPATDKDEIRVPFSQCPCYLINKTQYCEECAKKLHYRCPECGGLIKKVRDDTGKVTNRKSKEAKNEI